MKAPTKPAPYTSKEALKAFEAAPEGDYRLGEGDALTIQVWDRPDLSVAQTVGPDGAITVPVAGTLKVTGKTREEATQAVKDALMKFYAKIAVTVRVDRYVSNRVIILGQVRLPGVVQFDTMPNLLEAIARAGGVVPTDPSTNVTHCAIVRGTERVAWIDLRSLLQDADLSLNLRLQPNDIVFIPERGDAPVYVLGQVAKPGLFKWKPGMSLIDALGLAGGATRDANAMVQVVSPGRGVKASVSVEEACSGFKGHNIILQSGDIVYLSTSGLADFGYLIEKLNPYSWFFLGATLRANIVR